MARYIFVAILLVSLFYMFQATPMPQDAQQQPPQQQQTTNNLDNIADQVKKAWNGAADTLHERMGSWLNETNLNEAMDRVKSFINQAGESIRREAEKLGERVQD